MQLTAINKTAIGLDAQLRCGCNAEGCPRIACWFEFTPERVLFRFRVRHDNEMHGQSISAEALQRALDTWPEDKPEHELYCQHKGCKERERPRVSAWLSRDDEGHVTLHFKVRHDNQPHEQKYDVSFMLIVLTARRSALNMPLARAA